jgi:Zinc dependent phospholipase C
VRHRGGKNYAALAIAFAIASSIPTRVLAWDSGTHRLITRVAVMALPRSAPLSFFDENLGPLQQYSTDPDTKLRERYGVTETRRHYLDIEVYDSDWSALMPDRAAMVRKYGYKTLDRSGTLPWTIEEVANALEHDWARGDCKAVMRDSGYLAHYIGDASQPLHMTIHHDGITYADRGVHARFENAVDAETPTLMEPVQRDVDLKQIDQVWNPVIAEMRRAFGLVQTVIDADRYAGSHSSDPKQYREVLMSQQRGLIEHQLADAASVLAEVWIFEWNQADRPISCQPGYVPTAASSDTTNAGIPSQ